jgi:hypothetical protein
MYVSRLPERVRAALGRRAPGRHRRPATDPVAPPAPRTRLTLDVSGAMVRPCVANLGVTPRNARAGAQGDRWEAAR